MFSLKKPNLKWVFWVLFEKKPQKTHLGWGFSKKKKKKKVFANPVWTSFYLNSNYFCCMYYKK